MTPELTPEMTEEIHTLIYHTHRVLQQLGTLVDAFRAHEKKEEEPPEQRELL